MALEHSETAQYYPDILAQALSDIFSTLSPPLRLSIPAFIDYQTAQEAGESGLASIFKFIHRDQSFRRFEEAYRALDVAIVGIGALEDHAWAYTTEYLGSKEEVDMLKQAGVCGDIVCRFYRDVIESPAETREDIDISKTKSEKKIKNILYQTNRRAIGVSLRQLRQRISEGARVIAIAGGKDGAKALAIYGALINGFITDLVTDEVTARRISEIAKEREIG